MLTSNDSLIILVGTHSVHIVGKMCLFPKEQNYLPLANSVISPLQGLHLAFLA